MKYFSVKISHALTVTNNSKELTVYLEKSSSPLNKKQQQKKNNAATCLPKNKRPKQPKAEVFQHIFTSNIYPGMGFSII